MPWRQRQLAPPHLHDQSHNVIRRAQLAQIHETSARPHRWLPLFFFFFDFFAAVFFLLFVVVAVGLRAAALFTFLTLAFFFATFFFFTTRFFVVVAFFPSRFVAEDFLPDALPPPNTFSQPAA